MFFSLAITGFAIYFLIVITYYWKKEIRYTSNLPRIRKIYYLLVFITLDLGFFFGYLWITNWLALVTIFGLALIADLMIIQSLNLTKLWNAEFQHDTKEKVNQALLENEKNMNLLNKKASILASIVQSAGELFEPPDDISKYWAYSDKLEHFLSKYTDNYEFSLCLYQFTNTEEMNIDLKDRIFHLSIAHGLLDIPDKIIQDITDSLCQAKVNALSDKVMLIPFFGDGFNTLIVVEEHPEKRNLLQIDAWYILVLANVYEDYLQRSA